MKQIKLLVSFLFVVAISFSSAAQDKMTVQANKKLAKLSKEIVTGNADAKLSKKQEKEILGAMIENSKEIKKVQKTVKDKVEKQAKIKELYKTFAKKLKTKILTKEQNAARQKGKKLLKK